VAATADIVPQVHRLANSFVNWYLVEDGGRLTAVDAGLPGFKGSLASDFSSLGLRPEDVEAVILTHSDADHTGLAGALQAAGARVLIHGVDDPKLRRPGPKSGDARPVNMVPHMWRPTFWQLAGTMIIHGGGRPAKFEGAETFENGVLDVPGHPRVISTPGHTPGHCAFYFEEHGALFVGDAICTKNPLTGGQGPQLMSHGFNESDAQSLASLDAIEPIDAEVLLPGHGEPWRDGAARAVAEARSRA
jgi:glyoxylase-like metal-dependent hydrolase (beta-lactamase superfamily II)